MTPPRAGLRRPEPARGWCQRRLSLARALLWGEPREPLPEVDGVLSPTRRCGGEIILFRSNILPGPAPASAAAAAAARRGYGCAAPRPASPPGGATVARLRCSAARLAPPPATGVPLRAVPSPHANETCVPSTSTPFPCAFFGDGCGLLQHHLAPVRHRVS